ncbi:MAG TPA: metallophosphoesterase [Thermoleophilaceae bacterium]|nr:metallophosphoesterase [Thermoleophilaceae bacterium]
MATTTESPAAHAGLERSVRVAAAGDVHCSEANRDQIHAAFAAAAGDVDLILLAGDLTTHGEPEQAAVLADACRDLPSPVVAVLGKHDWHLDRAIEVAGVLRDAGVVVLDRDHAVQEVGGLEVGIVGVKGFVGGFPGSHLPDFGEPSLRSVYAEASAEVEALDAGLRAVAPCALRVVLMHYAPVTATLAGEPPEIWAFLGTDRLAAPVSEHGPDVVLHGHAHAGTFRGEVHGVPVFNVSVPVIGQDFWRFELTEARRPPEALR